jgi:hypothetical protein
VYSQGLEQKKSADDNNKINQRRQEVEKYYLKHRFTITTANLAVLLPKLESKIEARHTVLQFNSFYLFMKLCYQYRTQLPEDYRSFQDAQVLTQKFLALKSSKWLQRQPKHEEDFVHKALAALSPATSAPALSSFGPHTSIFSYGSSVFSNPSSTPARDSGGAKKSSVIEQKGSR